MPKSASQVSAHSRVHGGADAMGAVPFDFSTNSNACGPCPIALAAVQQADPSAYPDPSYMLLRTQLGAHHGVDPARVVVAGSASEFIFRITAWVAQQYWADDERQGQGLVSVPRNAYGDCAYAPLRLHGVAALDAQQRARVWQLYSPNKSLGLSGVRAAYAVCPMGMQGAVAELEAASQGISSR